MTIVRGIGFLAEMLFYEETMLPVFDTRLTNGQSRQEDPDVKLRLPLLVTGIREY